MTLCEHNAMGDIFDHEIPKMPKQIVKSVLVKGQKYDEFHEIRITYLPKEVIV